MFYPPIEIKKAGFWDMKIQWGTQSGWLGIIIVAIIGSLTEKAGLL